jgi:acyl-CoA thioester hydrolase
MHELLGSPFIISLKKMGVLTPVRAFDLEFLFPVTWDDELRLEVRVSAINQHSFSFVVSGYLNVDTLAFNALITYVTVSIDKKEKIKIPDKLVKVLNCAI